MNNLLDRFTMKSLRERIDLYFAKDSWLLPVIVFLIISISFYFHPPFAVDDLLRDVVAWKYGFNYQKMYPNSGICLYNQYIGFDFLAYFLSSFLKSIEVMHTIQLICGIFFSYAVFRICELGLKDHPDKITLSLTIFLIMLSSAVGSRLFLGRPELIFSAWLILAYQNRYPFVWAITGVLLSPFYWLAPFYLIGVLLLPVSLRKKLFIGFGIGLAQVLFWHLYSKGEWGPSIFLWKEFVSNRVTKVIESAPLYTLLTSKYFAALLGGIFYFSYDAIRKNFDVILVILFFSIFNMARYIIVFFPLGIILLVNGEKFNAIRLSKDSRLGFFIFCLYLTLDFTARAPQINALPQFNLDSKEYVLTPFAEATFALPFFGSGVRVSPSMELGASSKEIQQLSADLIYGRKPNCDILKKYSFTFLVEKELHEKADCLQLEQINGPWRLWKIKY